MKAGYSFFVILFGCLSFYGHQSFFLVRGSISFLTRRRISSIASAILFNCVVLSSKSSICFKFSIPSFIYFFFLFVSYNIPYQLSSLKLAAWSFNHRLNFLLQPGVVLRRRTTHSSFVAIVASITTSVIVVYIPQLTTPDPRSAGGTLLRFIPDQVHDLSYHRDPISCGSGISSKLSVYPCY